MAPQNFNLVGRLKKLLSNETTRVGRARVTLDEIGNPREVMPEPVDALKKK